MEAQQPGMQGKLSWDCLAEVAQLMPRLPDHSSSGNQVRIYDMMHPQKSKGSRSRCVIDPYCSFVTRSRDD